MSIPLSNAGSDSSVWSSDIEKVLENMRVNCVIMSKEHKNRYIYLKGILRYFRIPIIFISSVASVISVGLQPYVEQSIISVITCLLSLSCGIIGSIELFLGIQFQMENELLTSKDYYILSIEIYKILTLDPENRSIDGKSFLDVSYGTYVKLIENSNVISNKITDHLSSMRRDIESSNGSLEDVENSFSTNWLGRLTKRNNFKLIPIPESPRSPRSLNRQNYINQFDQIDESLHSLQHIQPTFPQLVVPSVVIPPVVVPPVVVPQSITKPKPKKAKKNILKKNILDNLNDNLDNLEINLNDNLNDNLDDNLETNLFPILVDDIIETDNTKTDVNTKTNTKTDVNTKLDVKTKKNT